MARFLPLSNEAREKWSTLGDGGRRRWLIAIVRYWISVVYKDKAPPPVLGEILTVASMVADGSATIEEMRFVSGRLPWPYDVECGWHCQQCALPYYDQDDELVLVFAANTLRLDRGEDFLLSLSPE